MSTRIRYVKTSEDGVLNSMRSFETAKGKYKVTLNLNNMSFKIWNVDIEETHEGGNTKNLAVLKRQAKRKLKELGVDFDIETRDNTSRINNSAAQATA